MVLAWWGWGSQKNFKCLFWKPEWEHPLHRACLQAPTRTCSQPLGTHLGYPSPLGEAEVPLAAVPLPDLIIWKRVIRETKVG